MADSQFTTASEEATTTFMRKGTKGDIPSGSSRGKRAR